MPLDPQVAAFRDRLRDNGIPSRSSLPLAEARALDREFTVARLVNGEPVASVTDRTIPGPDSELSIRVYRPKAGTLPVVGYFFGGGWTLGGLDTPDVLCRALTNAVGCVTVTVAYRLAPEHKFPAAVEDCYAAVRWIAEHAAELDVDADRLAVAGDSAGGNLAAVTALLARDRGGPAIVHQLLAYPVTDHASDTPSLRDNDDPHLFNRHALAWYWGHYLASPADGANPLASPLRAPSLAGLPPATVITAECDPVRDQAEQYARRLADAGVPTELTRYDGMAHAFFTAPDVFDRSKEALAYAAERLRGAYA
jgi:acetyl esterase